MLFVTHFSDGCTQRTQFYKVFFPSYVIAVEVSVVDVDNAKRLGIAKPEFNWSV